MASDAQTPFHTLTQTELIDLIEAGVKWYGGVKLPHKSELGKTSRDKHLLGEWRRHTCFALKAGWLQPVPADEQD